MIEAKKGRPFLPPEKKLHYRRTGWTAAQLEKIQRNGGWEFARQAVERAKEKKS